MGSLSVPRRDNLPELLGRVLSGLVIGLAAVAAIDGLATLGRLGSFGHLSGWLIGILPVWQFVEEFRARAGVPYRLPIALAGILVGLALGSLAAAATGFLAPLGSGAVGAAVACLVYAVVWFSGIRYAQRR